MSRSALIVLRVLAVGSALTILACHVVNKQQQAGATGERGGAGSAAGDEKPERTRMSGTKSMRIQHGPVTKLKAGDPAPPAATPNPPVLILGTKSSRLFQPEDISRRLLTPPAPEHQSPPPRPAFHGTKSMRVLTPADLQQRQQQSATPAQQSIVAQP